jgi:hypothetical protein
VKSFYAGSHLFRGALKLARSLKTFSAACVRKYFHKISAFTENLRTKELCMQLMTGSVERERAEIQKGRSGYSFFC